METLEFELPHVSGLAVETLRCSASWSAGRSYRSEDNTFLTMEGLSPVGCRETGLRVSKSLLSLVPKLVAPGLHSTLRAGQMIVLVQGPKPLGLSTLYDLPLALVALVLLGVPLHANPLPYELTQEHLRGLVAFGELSLAGEVRPVGSAGVIAAWARSRGAAGILCAPEDGGISAERLEGFCPVWDVTSLEAAVRVVGTAERPTTVRPLWMIAKPDVLNQRPSLDDIQGMEEAKETLALAAVGRHPVVLLGPRGTGATLLGRRAGALLGPLSRDAQRRILDLFSIGRLWANNPPVGARPFRAPHHTMSAGLSGGTVKGLVRPGEGNLASEGVLFLDDVVEFKEHLLQELWANLAKTHPSLEAQVGVAPERPTHTLPFDPWVLMSCAPCPSGCLGSCSCSLDRRKQYAARLCRMVPVKHAPIHLALRQHLPTPRPHTPPPELTEAALIRRVSEARARLEFLVPAPPDAVLDLPPAVLEVARSVAAWEGAEAVTVEHITRARQLAAWPFALEETP